MSYWMSEQNLGPITTPEKEKARPGTDLEFGKNLQDFLDLAFKFLNKYAAKNNVKKSSRTAGKLRG